MVIAIYHPRVTVKAIIASDGEIVLTVEPP